VNERITFVTGKASLAARESEAALVAVAAWRSAAFGAAFAT
jgi:hypothetical protein